MQRGGRQFLLPFRRGLDQAVRTAVCAKELYSFLADGVVYLLSGGFASQQSLELGHDHFVTQLTGVGALLGGNAGGRRNDQPISRAAQAALPSSRPVTAYLA